MSIGGHQSPVNRTDVWLTSSYILKPLGVFDLDPCAAPEPRPWPTATTHYTKERDGLSQPWRGRVWLNPPYGNPTIIGPWLRKMVAHHHGTALIFVRTETNLFYETVWKASSAILFLKGRLFFCHPDGSAAKGNAGVVKKGPFVELVCFSDCEGVIGSAVSSKLAKDFADHHDKFTTTEDDWFMKRYREWTQAFAMAANDGAVDFH